MKIIKSEHAGFCFGVSNIDQKVKEALSNKEKKVYAYGPLIHNRLYMEKRESQGLHILNDLKELDENSIVIFRAHGIPMKERLALENTKAQVIDGTCPVLLHIYEKGQKKNEEGFQIVIIGDYDHPEIIAMASYFNEDTQVIKTIEEAKAFKAKKKLYILSQTTNRRDYFDEILEHLTLPEGSIVDISICQATKNRQEAAKKLAKNVDAMIVIGSKQSSNSRKLAQVCEKVCNNTQFIENFPNLTLQNIHGSNKIGITAGASTPDWIIEEVVIGMDNFSKEDFMEQIEDSMVKIYPKDIVKGTVIAVKDDEVFVDIRFRSDGIIKADEMSDEEMAAPHDHFHEGDEIDVYVIKLDDGEGNVSLSTRRVEGLKNWKKLVDKFEAGETVEASVYNVNSGGLVVNVMGINGFIPASQITTYYVKNFKQFIGQTLECKIISIDERKRRVVLSSRAVKEEQLDDVWEKIVVGEQIEGTIVRMVDFGAFVDLGGVDGLIHVSDIAWERIDKPSDALEVGQVVKPLVLKANRERNRISLGLKQLQAKPFELFKQNNKVGDKVKGTVVNMLDFGAFVRMEEGVEGLVHVSQVANHHVEKPSDELNIGDEIEVKILDIDEERERIALSIRALEEPKEVPEQTYTPQAPRERDFSKFEQKPKQEKKKQPARKERQKEEDLFFDNNADIGTNLGDLIAAQLNKVENSDVLIEEAPEEATEDIQENEEN